MVPDSTSTDASVRDKAESHSPNSLTYGSNTETALFPFLPTNCGWGKVQKKPDHLSLLSFPQA